MAPDQDRTVLSVFGALVAVAAFLIAAVAVIAVVSNDHTSGTKSSGPVAVSLSEYKITPSTINVPVGGSVEVTNAGSMPHNLTVAGGPATPDIAAGKTATLDLSSLKAGTYEVTCSIAGHAAAGMKGTLVIGGSGSSSSSGSSDMAGMSSPSDVANGTASAATYQAMDDAMTAGMTDYVNAFLKYGTGVPTAGRGNQPLTPALEADGFKHINLTASIIDWEVEPGKTVKAWSYNGMVPGPSIRVEPGDKLRITLKNDTPMGQDIHWHGIDTPFGQDGLSPLTQPMIQPGESYTYEFTAPAYHEMGMYHAHNNGAISVVNGLYGQFQIGDVPLPNGKTVSGTKLPDKITVNTAMSMVLNDAGNIGLSLNGKAFPATDPIVAKVGETLQVTYHNEGLQCHPMHLHHVKQLVIEKDDWALDQPYYVDTLTICPGERYTVLISPTADDVGIWAYHCHILTHAETDKGLAYMVTALVVPPVPPAGTSAG
jgi:plastocyanin